MKTEDVHPGAVVCLDYLGRRHTVQVTAPVTDERVVVLLSDGTPVTTTPGALEYSTWENWNEL